MGSGLALVILFCCNKIPHTRRLKQQRLISHSSQSWEVQGNAAGRVNVWTAPGFVDICLLAVISHEQKENSRVPFIRA